MQRRSENRKRPKQLLYCRGSNRKEVYSKQMLRRFEQQLNRSEQLSRTPEQLDEKVA
jgi:hypothetical protein